MKKNWISLLLFISSFVLNSQTPLLLRSSFSSGGASTIQPGSNSTVSFPQSIGQHSVTGVFSVKNLELRQGFIQPVTILKTSPEAHDDIISIYPNPSSSVVFIKLNEKMTGYLECRITDAAGRMVLEKKIPAEEICQISLSSFYRGIYILSIRNKNTCLNYKIIKN